MDQSLTGWTPALPPSSTSPSACHLGVSEGQYYGYCFSAAQTTNPDIHTAVIIKMPCSQNLRCSGAGRRCGGCVTGVPTQVFYLADGLDRQAKAGPSPGSGLGGPVVALLVCLSLARGLLPSTRCIQLPSFSACLRSWLGASPPVSPPARLTESSRARKAQATGPCCRWWLASMGSLRPERAAGRKEKQAMVCECMYRVR